MAALQKAPIDDTAAINNAPQTVSNANAAQEPSSIQATRSVPTPMLIGEFLSTIRQSKGYSLQDVRLATKVKIIHLEAIEKGDRAALPTTAFAAGFVKAYAKFLELDPDECAAQFRAELIASETPAAAAIARPEPAPVKPAIATPAMATNEPAIAEQNMETPAKTLADNFTLMAGAAAAGICALIFAGAILTKKPVSAPEAGADIVAAVADPAPVITPKPQRIFAEMANLYDEGAAPQDTAVGAETITTAKSETKKTVATPIAESPRSQTELAPVAPKPLAAITPLGTPDEPVVKTAETAQTQAELAIDIAAPIPSDETPTSLAEPAPQAARPAPVIVEASLVNAPVAKFPRNCAAPRGAIINVGVVFDIAANGRPANAKIASSDNGCFDSAALAAADTMKFAPRTVDGKPAIESAKRVTIRFQG
ncbi:MAG: TonB family protein [Parvularculaceae bacterium]